jgi:F-type H+-transporting ATPase subunit delta
MTRLGRSYAQAFLDSAPANYDVEGFLTQAQGLLHALAHPQLRAFFLAPAVPQAAKQKALEEIAGRVGLDAYGLRFFRVVLENRRMGSVGEILAALREGYDRRRGVVEARVAVAAGIGEEQSERIARALSRRVGKTVRVHLETDPSILAGFVARVGSEVFDASTARAIDRFAENVKEGIKA